METIIIVGLCLAVALYYLVTGTWDSMTFRVKGHMAQIARDLDGELIDESTVLKGPDISVKCNCYRYDFHVHVFKKSRGIDFSITMNPFPSEKKFMVSKSCGWGWWDNFAFGHNEKNSIILNVMSNRLMINGDDRDFFETAVKKYPKAESALHTILVELKQGGFGVSSNELRSFKTFNQRDTYPARIRKLVEAFSTIADACK